MTSHFRILLKSILGWMKYEMRVSTFGDEWLKGLPSVSKTSMILMESVLLHLPVT